PACCTSGAVVSFCQERFLAKIAVEFEPTATRRGPDSAVGRPQRRALARGDGWRVSDVICSAGPHDRSFEEQDSDEVIPMVIEGSFQYESGAGRELMTPGSRLLGNSR